MILGCRNSEGVSAAASADFCLTSVQNLNLTDDFMGTPLIFVTPTRLIKLCITCVCVCVCQWVVNGWKAQEWKLQQCLPDGVFACVHLLSGKLQLRVSLFVLTCVHSAGGELLTGAWLHNRKGD